jgi:hypothetical protein
MLRIIASLLLIIGFTGAAAAGYDSPKALAEAIYAPYGAGQKQDAPEQFYSTRLRGLLATNLERQGTDQSGAPVDFNAPDMLTFDPFIEGQNSLLLDLVIGEPMINGDSAVVTVTFHNFDHRSILSIAMVREAGGWTVDDVASLTGSQNWLLSWLLQYDPFGVN